MNRIAAITLIALATLASTSNRASAQSHRIVTEGNIPFAFSVNGVVLPAGRYIVSSYSPNLLEIRNASQPGSSAMVLTREGDKANPNGTTKMVFERYGSQCFLHEVFSPTIGLDSVVPPSTQEKKARIELAKASGGQPVLVAVK